MYCWHSTWTLVNSAREDSLECDSELPVLEIKRHVTVTLMVFFFIFGSFLIFWANLRFVFDEFKRLPHAQRKRRNVKDTFLDLIYKSLFFSSHRAPWTAKIQKKSLFFFSFCVNRCFLMRFFPHRFFFMQYAAPSTEAFVWPSQFYAKVLSTKPTWLAQLALRAPVCWAGGRLFKPRPDQHSGSFNNCRRKCCFLTTSANGYTL